MTQEDCMLMSRFYYEKVFIAQKGVINPEEALPMAIPGAFCMTVSDGGPLASLHLPPCV